MEITIPLARAVVAMVVGVVASRSASAADSRHTHQEQEQPALLAIAVLAPQGMPSAIVHAAVDEAARVWRAAGVVFEWHVGDRGSAPILVVVSDEIGAGAPDALALGWLEFRDGLPGDTIHLSRRNAAALERAIHAHTAFMLSAPFDEDALIGRALGRALAHELGHFLLASPEHTRDGLMSTERPPTQFFSPKPLAFAIDAVQRDRAIRRIEQVTQLGAHSPAVS